MNELSILIDITDKKPIYEQIYDFIKKEIRQGKFASDMKLPSTRALAVCLNVSRSTVQLAYDQLVSEGYIEARPYKGYYVLKIDGLYNIGAAEVKKPAKSKQTENCCGIDFSPNGIELDNFPYNAWRKVSRAVMQMEDKALFNIGHPMGDYELRGTIAGYLHGSRGVECSPDNIIVGAGGEYLLMLLDRLFTAKYQTNVRYAMENPTYRKSYLVLSGMGREVVPVRLDEMGMRTDELKDSGADIAYVTPSHQYPLGIVMSIGRRFELLNWSNERDGRYIIEDDYDSEFRYKGKPIPALQGLDRNGKVIYIGTFSKSIAPGIRMGYMVLPDSLMDVYRDVGMGYSNTVSRLDQNIVNLFIEEGYYERHLNKMRGIYKAKHDTLLGCLKAFGTDYAISGDSAGLHILFTSSRMTENEMIDAARKKGVKVYPLSSFYLDGNGDGEAGKENAPYGAGFRNNTVIMGYARLTEDEIVKGVKLLAEAFYGKDM